MKESSGCVGSIWGVLTVIFVVAKLAGFIDWPWWLVLWPMWAGAIVGLAVLIILTIGIAVAVILDQ